MDQEKKIKLNYNKQKEKDGNKIIFYGRILAYVAALIMVMVLVYKLNSKDKSKSFDELRKNSKVKAEIYGNGSIYNNYYYGVRLSRPSADWEIIKIQDVYDSSITAATIEERIKPIARFVVKNKEEEMASVVLNTIILNEQRTSQSLAEESFRNLLSKYGENKIEILQQPTINNKRSLKACYYVVKIINAEKTATIIELFIVKNRRAFNLHEETHSERYDTYQWDFEHFINNLVIYGIYK